MFGTKVFLSNTSGSRVLKGKLGGIIVSGLFWFNSETFKPLVLTPSGTSRHALLTISSKPCNRPSGLGLWIVGDMTAFECECDVTVPHVVVVSEVVVVEVAMEVVVVAIVIKRLV